MSHSCEANLASNENEVIISGGEVSVYRSCKVCGDEFETIYEYSETIPA